MLRRSFLAGVGTTALGTMLRPIMAYAQAGISPQRLLLIHRPCGNIMGIANAQYPGDTRWWPSGGATGWTASPLLSSFTDGKIASLQDQMLILKHINCPRSMNWLGDKHGAGFLGMMTPPLKDVGAGTWPQLQRATGATAGDPNGKSFTAGDQSIDQLLLSQIPGLGGGVQGGPTCPVPHVELTASTESADQIAQGGDAHCLRVTAYKKAPAGSKDPTIPLWPEPSPANAFKNYFMAGLMNMDAAQIMRAQAQNKSVLDFAGAGLSALKTQVPPSQLAKVQSHLQAISDLEANLKAMGAPGAQACAPPVLTGGPLTPSPVLLDTQTYPIWQQHKEIIKTMFQCDLTRVLSFTFGYGNSAIHFSNVLKDQALAGKYMDTSGNPFNNGAGHHDISHNGGDYNNSLYIIDKYYCDMTAQLLAEMSMTPDIGGGTLLDNTMVVFWNENSCGNVHGAVDMPVLLFGGKFLKMKGGTCLTLGPGTMSANSSTSKPPAPYMSDFWTALAQTWGYTGLTQYGDASWNTGPISGIFG